MVQNVLLPIIKHTNRDILRVGRELDRKGYLGVGQHLSFNLFITDVLAVEDVVCV